ncbi:MAG: hypothetical protein ACFE0O_10545 [Opitutales bacterium]
MDSNKRMPSPGEEAVPASVLTGLRFARGSAWLLAAMLVGWGPVRWFLAEEGGLLLQVEAVYALVMAVLVVLPYRRIVSDKRFFQALALLALAAVGLVFLLIAHVMFGYMAAAERGEKLGVPGFEGTVIFLTLLQLPTVLFERRPHLLT